MYTVTNSESYAQLERDGIIKSEFYEINDISLTAPYALQQRPFLVRRDDKVIGIHFSADVAEEHMSGAQAEYPGIY